jgi:hypothetical protein
VYEKMELKLSIYLCFSLSESTVWLGGWVDPRASQHAAAKVNPVSCLKTKCLENDKLGICLHVGPSALNFAYFPTNGYSQHKAIISIPSLA